VLSHARALPEPAHTALQGPQSCRCGIRRALCSRLGEQKSKASRQVRTVHQTNRHQCLPTT
jgi:hypothetical protein